MHDDAAVLGKSVPEVWFGRFADKYDKYEGKPLNCRRDRVRAFVYSVSFRCASFAEERERSIILNVL